MRYALFDFDQQRDLLLINLLSEEAEDFFYQFFNIEFLKRQEKGLSEKCVVVLHIVDETGDQFDAFQNWLQELKLYLFLDVLVQHARLSDGHYAIERGSELRVETSEKFFHDLIAISPRVVLDDFLDVLKLNQKLYVVGRKPGRLAQDLDLVVLGLELLGRIGQD